MNVSSNFKFHKPINDKTTFTTKTTKLYYVFNLIDIGVIQHIEENECFFKLQILQTNQ